MAMIDDVVAAIATGRGEGPSGLGRFLRDYEFRHGDAGALVGYGRGILAKALLGDQAVGHLEVLEEMGLLTSDGVHGVLCRLAHVEAYDEFVAVYRRFWGAQWPSEELALHLCYFNESHDLEKRIDVLTEVGLLDLSAAQSAPVNALILCAIGMKDVATMRILVDRLPRSDGLASNALAFGGWFGGGTFDAEFFLSNGARVEATGFSAIFGALVSGNQAYADYLARASEVPVESIIALGEAVHGNPAVWQSLRSAHVVLPEDVVCAEGAMDIILEEEATA